MRCDREPLSKSFQSQITQQTQYQCTVAVYCIVGIFILKNHESFHCIRTICNKVRRTIYWNSQKSMDNHKYCINHSK